MSERTGIRRNEKDRDAVMEAARLAFSEIIVAAKFGSHERLAELDLVKLRAAVDLLETHKRRMAKLLQEYAELAALA